ncbi:F-box domain [Fusarium albosuccineum]|uniref:F-box domain n=1 Tax=Fusarium albosuccineum TaxID=1237068 RepID=A0A8H4L5R3_9HYPO|nr:F-box domain [Fusarium albosuccineum]
MALPAKTYALALGLGDLSLREGKATNQGVKGPLNLLDLPYDVVYSIFSKLCYHCQPRDTKSKSTEDDETEHALADRRGLWSLCLTSRASRRMAQPILFHHVFHTRHNSQTTLVRLIRTLNEQPHLDKHVKMLELRSVRGHSLHWDPPFYLKGEESRFIQKVTRSVRLGVPSRELHKYVDQETVMELLLVLLPSLVELRFVVPGSWYRSFRYLAKWHGKRVGADKHFLSSVKKMELLIGEEVSGTYYSKGPDRGPRPTPIEQLLISAAPNLETLSCSMGGLYDMPSLPRLQSLTLLVVGFRNGEIGRVLQNLPSLRCFSYTSFGEFAPSGSEMCEALQSSKDTLEELLIRYNGFEYDFGSDRPPWYLVPSLNDFTRLKHLSIDQDFVWWWKDSPAKLTTLLPQGLETLFLDVLDRGWRDDTNIIFPLAKALYNGASTRLRGVIWGRGCSNRTYLEMDLELMRSKNRRVDENWFINNLQI